MREEVNYFLLHLVHIVKTLHLFIGECLILKIQVCGSMAGKKYSDKGIKKIVHTHTHRHSLASCWEWFCQEIIVN